MKDDTEPVWCDAEPVQPSPPKYRVMRICSHCGWERPDGTPCPKCGPPVVHHCPHTHCKWCKQPMPTMFIEGHEAECKARPDTKEGFIEGMLARPDTKVKTTNQGE